MLALRVARLTNALGELAALWTLHLRSHVQPFVESTILPLLV